MEYSNNRFIKLISTILVVSLFVGFLPWRELLADANTHGDYESYPFDITYEQNSTWNNSTQGQFEVTNISDYDVSSWSLEIDYLNDISINSIYKVFVEKIETLNLPAFHTRNRSETMEIVAR